MSHFSSQIPAICRSVWAAIGESFASSSAAAVIVLLLAAGVPANATPITPLSGAVYSGSLCTSLSGSCPVVLSTTGTITLGGSSLSFGVIPSPSITAFATAGNTVGSGDPVPATGIFQTIVFNTAGRRAGLQYYAEIVGPAGVALPVSLSYSLATTSALGSLSAAGILLNPSGHAPTFGVNADQIVNANVTVNGPLSSARSGILTDTILSNTAFDIGLFAYAGSSTQFLGSAFASVDPVLFIDPSFATIDPDYLSHYSIVLSTGVGNTAVPEPMTLTMFGVGVIGVAAMRRKRREAWPRI